MKESDIVLVQTSRFGELDIAEDEVFHFEEGIPGFRHVQKYAIIEVEESPFMYLQSADHGDVSFIVVSPFDFLKSYEFTLPEELIESLNIKNEQQVKIVSILSVRNDLASATINLGAPIILNTRLRLGAQYILPDGKYSIHHPLFAGKVPVEGGK
jgi:flagellar assembly factor FliW